MKTMILSLNSKLQAQLSEQICRINSNTKIFPLFEFQHENFSLVRILTRIFSFVLLFNLKTQTQNLIAETG